jgi:hypothetical protein
MVSSLTRIGWLASAALAAVVLPADANDRVSTRPIAQVRHLDEAELTFSGRLAADGAFEIEARGGELVFQKRSLPGGGFELDLSAPKDSVVISLNDSGITVERNRRRASMSLSAASIEDLDGIRKLLAGSAAVRLTRTAAAAVLESGDDGLSSTSLLIADALVGLMTGDEGAPAEWRVTSQGAVRAACGEWRAQTATASGSNAFSPPAMSTTRACCRSASGIRRGTSAPFAGS